jgi:hypothetical protein
MVRNVIGSKLSMGQVVNEGGLYMGQNVYGAKCLWGEMS